MSIQWINEYIQKNGLGQPSFFYSAEGPDEELVWTAEVEADLGTTFKGSGTGSSKSEAKRNACDQIKKQFEEYVPNVEINYACYSHLGQAFHSEKCIAERNKSPNIFTGRVSMLKYLKETYPGLISYEAGTLDQLRSLRCFTRVDSAINDYLKTHAFPKLKAKVEEMAARFEKTGEILPSDLNTKDDLEEVTKTTKVKSNAGETSIEPATMNQAMGA
jgi:hypothetical protein